MYVKTDGRVFVCPLKLLNVHMEKASCYLDGWILINGLDREAVIAPCYYVYVRLGDRMNEYVCLFNSSIDNLNLKYKNFVFKIKTCVARACSLIKKQKRCFPAPGLWTFPSPRCPAVRRN